MLKHLHGGNAKSGDQDIPRIDKIQAHAGKVTHIAGDQAQVVLQRSCGQQTVYGG